MTCEEMTDLIAGYPGGSLTPAERARLLWHTATCAACRTELAAAVVLAARVSDLWAHQPEPPPEVKDAIRASLTTAPAGAPAPAPATAPASHEGPWPLLWPELPQVVRLSLTALAAWRQRPRSAAS